MGWRQSSVTSRETHPSPHQRVQLLLDGRQLDPDFLPLPLILLPYVLQEPDHPRPPLETPAKSSAVAQTVGTLPLYRACPPDDRLKLTDPAQGSVGLLFRVDQRR